MPFPSQAAVADPLPRSWLASVESQQSGVDLASSPFAAPGFFLGWIGLGILVGAQLARRGHDHRTMVALGAGLGPLMVLVASETLRRRERDARPLVLAPGFERDGQLDVVVLVQGEPHDVQWLVPSLESVRSDLRTLTLARAVAYEWLESAPDNEVVTTASAALVAARTRLPFEGVRLEVHPGTPDTVARRFRAGRDATLVLHAIGDSTMDRRPNGAR